MLQMADLKSPGLVQSLVKTVGPSTTCLLQYPKRVDEDSHHGTRGTFPLTLEIPCLQETRRRCQKSTTAHSSFKNPTVTPDNPNIR